MKTVFVILLLLGAVLSGCEKDTFSDQYGAGEYYCNFIFTKFVVPVSEDDHEYIYKTQ